MCGHCRKPIGGRFSSAHSQTSASPIHVTPMTRDRVEAADWLSRFEGAGLDGVMAKPEHGTYEPGKRAMIKVKHARTADCVVAGFRWHKNGHGSLVGSLLLGLYDDRRQPPSRRRDLGIQHGRATRAGARARAASRATRSTDIRGANGPMRWRDGTTRLPGGKSRWSAGKDLSWEPLRVERVCEVKYDHMQGDRFRHAAIFLRWRFDKTPD